MRILPLMTAAILALVVLTALPAPGHAGPFDAFAEPVKVAVFQSLDRVPPGSSIDVALQLTLAGRWHINAHKTNEDYLIPTTVVFHPPAGITVQGVVYPPGRNIKLAFSENPLRLYEREALIGARLLVAPDTGPGTVEVKATVTYQACDNEKCLAPVDKEVSIPVVVSRPTEAIDAAHSDIFSRLDFGGISGDDGTALESGGGRLAAVVRQRGFFVAFLIVFVSGLALNLTPCVYPIIPITVGYFGGQSDGRPARTLGLAALYVLGMATMYSVLGLVAALTGSLFGTALQNPFVIAFVALVLVGLALSMFGAYEIRVPARLSNLAGASSSKGGTTGAFLMGLTVGIVAAPCIGPFVIALITFVGESGNPLLGFSMFFTLAVGLGTPFIVLAVLSGSISRLPKSGEWMEWVKKLFGMILLGMAVFFLAPLLADPVYWALMGGVFVVGGLLLGFLKKTQSSSLAFIVFKRFVGVAAPVLGLYLLLTPGHIIGRSDAATGIAWETFDAARLGAARAASQPVLIDFSADWCLPCKELDHKTFSRPQVIDAARGILTLRADLTQSASPEVKKLREDFHIRGVPTVIFIDSRGNERTDLRVLGFVDEEDFRARIEKLRTGST